MGRNFQRFLKSLERQFSFYTSDYFPARLWLEFRININDYFFPLPPMEEGEDTRKYLARISPDQAVTYSSYLVQMWSLDEKFFDSVDDSIVPKRSWRKMDKRRREIFEGAKFAEEFYEEALERKKREELS